MLFCLTFGRGSRISNGFLARRPMLRTVLVLAMAAVAACHPRARVSVGPCDVYANGGTPCVAAHSTARALYGGFHGPLYRVRRSSDRRALDVFTLAAGGSANASAQISFCANTYCTIQRIFDQSPRGNHLDTAPGGGHVHAPDTGVYASKSPVMVGGHPAFGAFFEGQMGYRNDNTSGVAVGDEPESMYMVVDGRHYNDKCCFDYGNAETDNDSQGPGTMEAVYFGNASGKLNHGGGGNGPWVMADLEAGLWGADVVVSHEASISHTFVTAIVKGDSSANTGKGHWAIKGGDAAAGNLTVYWDGARPVNASTRRWPNSTDAPMKKQGAIILGIGGDNSNGAIGTFFEGAITAGYSTDSIDDAVQANIVAAGYSLV